MLTKTGDPFYTLSWKQPDMEGLDKKKGPPINTQGSTPLDIETQKKAYIAKTGGMGLREPASTLGFGLVGNKLLLSWAGFKRGENTFFWGTSESSTPLQS